MFKLIKKVLGRKVSYALRRKISGSKYYFTNLVKEPELTEIGKIFGTDKFDNNHTFHLSYLDIYERYFQPLRYEKIKLLEIGVKDGASHRTWKNYFQNGLIYGIDIDPYSKNYEEDRIEIAIGSQDDDNFLKDCFNDTNNFDIIIDDGSHINKHIIKSFDYLFNNRLKSGGIYIIEDLQCSYLKLQSEYNILENWPGMKYNNPSQNYDNSRKDMNDFFLEKIKTLDYLQGNILSMHFWAMVCIITKV